MLILSPNLHCKELGPLLRIFLINQECALNYYKCIIVFSTKWKHSSPSSDYLNQSHLIQWANVRLSPFLFSGNPVLLLGGRNSDCLSIANSRSDLLIINIVVNVSCLLTQKFSRAILYVYSTYRHIKHYIF